MPGPQLQTTALLLGRQPTGADAFESWTAFSEEHGHLTCLGRLAKPAPASTRRPPKPAEAALDLFDEAELTLETSNQGRTWFIKEHRLLVRHPGLGRGYETLRAAARLATLITRNEVSADSRPALAGLLRVSFAALADGARPDLVWLKALYCFLRDEGYPVKQHWWTQLPAADRTAAAQILRQPLAGQAPAPDLAARLTTRLEHWVAGDTEIRLG